MNCLLSGDGRYVFFDSWADNLVPGISNREDNVFKRDLVTGAVTRVSVDAQGNQISGAVTQLFWLGASTTDGRYVAMSSFYSLQTDGKTPSPWCYVKDTQTGGVAVIEYQGGNVGIEEGFQTLSADGRYALVMGEDVVPGQAEGIDEAFVLDRQEQTLDWVDVGMGGRASNGYTCPFFYGAAGLNEDGQYAVFVSDASNLVANGTANYNVYLRDRTTETTELVSATSSGAPWQQCRDRVSQPRRPLRGLHLQRPGPASRGTTRAWWPPISGTASPGRPSA